MEKSDFKALQEKFLNGLSERKISFDKVPKRLQDNNFILESLKIDGEILIHLDIKKIPDNLILTALKQNGNVLSNVPSYRITKKMCLEAVKQNEDAIYLVPITLRDKEIYYEAFKKNVFILPNLPKDYFSKKVNDKDIYYFLNIIKNFKNDIVLKEFQKYIDENDLNNTFIITDKMLNDIKNCLFNMINSGNENFIQSIKYSFWEYFPEYLFTEKLSLQIISNNAHNLIYIPKKFFTKAFFKRAVQNNWEIIKVIPYEFLDKEICKIAVNKNGIAVKYIPDEFLDKEICLIALLNNIMSVKYISSDILF